MRQLIITALLIAVPAGAHAQEGEGQPAEETQTAAATATSPGVAESAPAAEGAPEEGAAEEGAALTPPEERTVAYYFGLGGFIMWVLVGCSVLVVGLVLERLWVLRRNAVIPRGFMRQVMDHWRKREIPKVVSLCASTNVSIARVLRSGLIHFDEGLGRVEDAIGAAGEHEATQLRRNLPLLAALGNIATMLGLLGTVLGMITSFELIADTGTGDARVVAGGIFQALITTAGGLIVGITAIALHSFLRRKVEVLEIDLEETSFRLIEEISVERDAGRPPEPEPSAAGLAPAEA